MTVQRILNLTRNIGVIFFLLLLSHGSGFRLLSKQLFGKGRREGRIVGGKSIIGINMGNGLEVPEVPRHIDFATEDSGEPPQISFQLPAAKRLPVEEFFVQSQSLANPVVSNQGNEKLERNTDGTNEFQRLRQLGIRTLQAGTKIPHPKAEAWRFTNIRRFFDPSMLANEIPASAITPMTIPSWTDTEIHKIQQYLQHYIDVASSQSHLVILNGRIEPRLSNLAKVSKKIHISSHLSGVLNGKSLPNKKLSEISENLFHFIPDQNIHPFKSSGSDVLTALNLMKMPDYLQIYVPKACHSTIPLQILIVNFDRTIDSSPSLIPTSAATTTASLSHPTEFRERMIFPRMGIYVSNASSFSLKQTLCSLPMDLFTNPHYETKTAIEIYAQSILQKDNRESNNHFNSLTNISQRLPTCNTAIREDTIDYSFMGGVTRVFTEPNSKVEHIFVQELAQNVRGFDIMSIDVGNNSRYDFFPVQMGSDMHRLNYHQLLREQCANTTFSGATLADTAQALDIHSTIIHNHTDTFCDQNHRLLLGEKAYAVFRGMLIMPSYALRGDGNQIMKAFMLGNESKVHCMPFLDLTCGDIKCSHGAAVGDLNKNDLSYLASRGIGPEIARPLLTKSFVFEVIQPVLKDEALAKRIISKMTRLNTGGMLGNHLFENAEIFGTVEPIDTFFAKMDQKKPKKGSSRGKSTTPKNPVV